MSGRHPEKKDFIGDATYVVKTTLILPKDSWFILYLKVHIQPGNRRTGRMVGLEQTPVPDENGGREDELRNTWTREVFTTNLIIIENGSRPGPFVHRDT